MTPPIFAGETYSYTDARKRAPDAWRLRIVGPWPGIAWTREEWDEVSPKGLGRFERAADGKHWVYIQPNGYALTASENYGKAEPPPLPRIETGWQQCGCHEGEHNCTACGKPYWLEFHGVGDGMCTYCYHRG